MNGCIGDVEFYPVIQIMSTLDVGNEIYFSFSPQQSLDVAKKNFSTSTFTFLISVHFELFTA